MNIDNHTNYNTDNDNKGGARSAPCRLSRYVCGVLPQLWRIHARPHTRRFPGVMPQGTTQCPRLSGTFLCVVRSGHIYCCVAVFKNQNDTKQENNSLRASRDERAVVVERNGPPSTSHGPQRGEVSIMVVMFIVRSSSSSSSSSTSTSSSSSSSSSSSTSSSSSSSSSSSTSSSSSSSSSSNYH